MKPKSRGAAPARAAASTTTVSNWSLRSCNPFGKREFLDRPFSPPLSFQHVLTTCIGDTLNRKAAR